MPDKLPAFRVVHLLGGLRAIDFGEPNVEVNIVPDITLCHFKRPEYPALYPQLQIRNLRPIGVEFYQNQENIDGIWPPDWRSFEPNAGFLAATERRAWSETRHVDGQRSEEVNDIGGRFATYFDLLEFRVWEISQAYNRTLRGICAGRSREEMVNDDHLHSNGYLLHIDAALHAFLADAASLRDLIGEAIWRLVLQRPKRDVATMAGLLKRTQDLTLPLIATLRANSAPGGWLKNLSDLRNGVIHSAPMANVNEIHMVCVRRLESVDLALPILHYPLTTATGEARKRPSRVDFADEAKAKVAVKEFQNFVETSGDALQYCLEGYRNLVDLARDVRTAAGLKSETLTLTDADIVGPIIFEQK